MSKNFNTPYPLRYFILLGSLLSLALFCTISCEAYVVEENLNNGSIIDTITSRDDKGLQTFLIDSPAKITGVKIWARATGSIEAGSFRVSIFDQFATGTELAFGYLLNTSAKITASLGSEYQVIFETSTEITATGTYYLVFYNSFPSPALSMQLYGSSGYSEGAYYFYDPSTKTWSLPYDDIYFQIIGEDIEMINCTTTLIEVSNTTTGASFWIDKSISYGDILIITIGVVFLIFGALKFILDLEIPKRMNFKR